MVEGKERMPEAYAYIAQAELGRNRKAEARAAIEEAFAKFPAQALSPEMHALRARLASPGPRKKGT